jgi:hypothetical protein
MSNTLKNKAAGMALFATMMAVGTLPLAAQAPSDYFLEAQDSSQENVSAQKSAEGLVNQQITIGSSVYENNKY